MSTFTQEEETFLYAMANKFQIAGIPTGIQKCEGGHINKTYRLTCIDVTGIKHTYILQELNTHVFPNCEAIENNIRLTTEHIIRIAPMLDMDPERATISFIPLRPNISNDSRYFYRENGSVWRIMKSIDQTYSMTSTNDLDMVYEHGKCVGFFGRMMSSFTEISQIREIIPNFHNTPKRFDALNLAAARAAYQNPERLKMVLGDNANSYNYLRFAHNRQNICNKITSKLEDGSIPLMVTHNDTKLSNLLFDEGTTRATCMIDLDTIMPGTILYDYGEGIRSTCSLANEDATDPTQVVINQSRFESFTRGFLAGGGMTIQSCERQHLYDGALLMTYENGIRFLTDFLDGDKYFAVDNEKIPNHNLVRARTQFLLVKQLELQRTELEKIILK